jgi:hypothetical protein
MSVSLGPDAIVRTCFARDGRNSFSEWTCNTHDRLHPFPYTRCLAVAARPVVPVVPAAAVAARPVVPVVPVVPAVPLNAGTSFSFLNCSHERWLC